MDEPVIADTGPIIHLAEAGVLDLLTLFDSFHIPHPVYQELVDGGVPDGFDDLAVSIHDVNGDEYPSLDPGESAALLLCTELNGALLTDDLDARDVAKADGIEVHGSIGVILYAFTADEIALDEAKALLRSLKRDTSLYLADPLVEHAIELVESGNSEW